nr:MAG TPA: hypothetical protein [Caudoviricetes sp.]
MSTPNRPQGQYNTSLPVLAREVFIRKKTGLPCISSRGYW